MNFDSNSNSEPDSDRLLPQYSPPDSESSDLVTAQLIKIQAPRLSLGGKLAWAFVIITTLALFLLTAYPQVMKEPAVGGDANSKELMQIQLTGKTIVGQKRFLESQGQPIPENIETVPKEFDTGSYEQRLCYAILVSEIEGAKPALDYLDELDEKVESSKLNLTDDQRQMRNTLLNLFQDYEDGDPSAEAVPAEERKLVEDRLEWIGKLAFLPVGTSQETERKELVAESTSMLIFGVIAMLLGGFMGIVGIGLAITFIALLSSNKIRSRFAHRSYDHSVYIETFAIWMLLFFGSSLLLGFTGIKSAQTAMLIQPFIFFGSLVSLGWPVMRGIPFSQVRKDIGWTSDNTLMESVSAIPVYLSTLPFMLPGVVIIAVMTSIVAGFHEPHEFARPDMAGHPVQDFIMQGGVTMILLIFLTACVAAPIVEETMFRGVLYRHLRDLTAGRRIWFSVMFSAVINGLIFASIHPQGIYGIPVLATLAIGFSLAREWRGSLVSPIVMHGIHNTLITCISLIIL